MFHRILFVFMFAVILLGLAGINPVFAQDDILPRDSSCIGCHENQYQLFDSGKWYCLRKTPVRCTECHGGRTDTAIKDLAHEGLVANPLVDQAARCQGCHPNDYQARVEKFASIAGIHWLPRPCPTCIPVELVSGSLELDGDGRPLRALPAGPWQAAGISVFGIAFLILFLFACRCWKSDHLCKNEK